MVSLLLIALACSVFSIIYYVRLLRLFWNLPTGQTLSSLMYQTTGFRAIGLTSNSYHSNSTLAASGSAGATYSLDRQVGFTSACLVALIYLPVFLVKPFVL
jgi:hypothetical protein